MSYAEMRHRPWTGNWLDVLNDREKKSMGDYAELHRQRSPHTPSSLDDVWNLGDNATSRCNWSEASGRIPTYRLHNQLFWYPAAARPLTILEKVASLAWPVYSQMLVDPALIGIAPSREEGKHMLGNAWHLATGTVVMLAALASVRLSHL